MILIMPTWREWIADEDYRLVEFEGTTEIPKTNYFRTWVSFLSSSELERIARDYNVQFVFYPHRNMQKYMKFFPSSTKYLEVADARKYDVQELMKKASLMITDYSSVFMDMLRNASMMITDYSSVFFDMLYMKKPVIYYQFDYDKFRKGQYGEGYFDYRDNPFGKSYKNADQVIAATENYIRANFNVSKEYLKAHADYFQLYDTDNCKRVYEVTREL